MVNTIYLVFTMIAWQSITDHLRTRRHHATDEALASPLTPAISVLVPAYNEEAGVVESVRSLLGLRYPDHEVVVVNDRSTDGTLARLREAFDLVPVRKAIRAALPYRPVRATYVSRRDSRLMVIDKENGGKADALNAAIDAASNPYVCAIDADAVLEQDALLRVARPIFDDPDRVVATGGIVRIANGCRIERGQVLEVSLPPSTLASLQVLEYFRAFLIGRVGWSKLRSLLIISGAFGLFRRSLVEVVGGYWTQTVGEDVELVVRLHRYLRERGEDYAIEFVPDPVCWTEAPETLRILSRQRRRWQRGLAETLWRHRRLLGNPRYGVFGLVAVPYFVVFELLGPLVEVVGLPATIAGWSLGLFSALFLAVFLLVAFVLGMLLSVAALALEEFSFRRYARRRELARLLLLAVVENVGYRQLTDLWRLVALVDVARRRRAWGEMGRTGLGTTPAEAAPAPTGSER